MATTYNLSSDVGTITIAESQQLDYKGLKLIGKGTADWNEPIQQNFVTLADMITTSNVSSVDNEVENLIGLYNSEVVYLTSRKMRFTITSLSNLYPYNVVSAIAFYDVNGDFIPLVDSLTVESSDNAAGSTAEAFYNEEASETGLFFLTERSGDSITIDFGDSFDSSKISKMVWRSGTSSKFRPDTKLTIETFDGTNFIESFEAIDIDGFETVFAGYTFKSLKVIELVDSIETRLSTVETDNVDYSAAINPLPDQIDAVKVKQEIQSDLINDTYNSVFEAVENVGSFNKRILLLEAVADLVSVETITTMQNDINVMRADFDVLETNSAQISYNVDLVKDIVDAAQSELDVLGTSYDVVKSTDVISLENTVDNLTEILAVVNQSNLVSNEARLILENQMLAFGTSLDTVLTRQDAASLSNIQSLGDDYQSLVADYDALIAEHVTLSENYSVARADINGALADVAVLTTTVTDLTTTNIIELQGQIDGIVSVNTVINNKMDSVEADVIAANQEVTDVVSQYDGLDARIQTVENNNLTFTLNTQRVIDLENKSIKAAKDIIDLTAFLNNVNLNVRQTNLNIAANTESQGLLNIKLDDLEARQDTATSAEILALTNQTNLLINQVDTSVSNIDIAAGKVAVMTASVDSAVTTVADATSTVSELNDRVVGVENDIISFNETLANSSANYDLMQAKNEIRQTEIDEISVYVNTLYTSAIVPAVETSSITGQVVPSLAADGSEIFTIYESGQVTVSEDCVVELLVVGGGGSGALRSKASPWAAGGGGSAVYHNRGFELKAGTHDIVIGKGGTLESTSVPSKGLVGNKGGNSSGFGIEVHGGGGGAYYQMSYTDTAVYDQLIGGCVGGAPYSTTHLKTKSSMEGMDRRYYKYNNMALAFDNARCSGGMGAFEGQMTSYLDDETTFDYETSKQQDGTGWPGYGCNITDDATAYGAGGGSVGYRGTAKLKWTQRASGVGGSSIMNYIEPYTLDDIIENCDALGYGNGGAGIGTYDGNLIGRSGSGSNGIIIIRKK